MTRRSWARLVCVGVAALAVSGIACRGRDAGRPDPGQPPQIRIISLTPSATEVVAALGATADLVGVDEYSTYPPEVARLPKVGSFLSPNLETIVSLKPTFVIVDDVHGSVAGALHDAGIATIECAMHALPDVKTALRTVGKQLGRDAEAALVITEIDTALDATAAKRPTRRPKVLAIIDREAGGTGNLVAAGPGSWIDELLAVVGADNVLAGSPVRYPTISLEEVLTTRPDVILDLSYPARTEITSWNTVDVPAVTQHRVIPLDAPFLVAPSPRVKAALDALSTAVAAPPK